MRKFQNLLVLIFLVFSVSVSAQIKWYQQKKSTLPTAIGIDGNASFPRNAQGGMIIDFDNDGLKDFIIPTYFSPQGNYDVQFVRFFKNLGTGQYKDVTSQMQNPDNNISGKFLVGMNDRRGVTLDFNKDGKMDFIFPSAWENSDYSNYDATYGFTKMKDYYFNTNPSNYIESRANGGYQAPSFFYQDNGVYKKGYNLFDTKTYTVDQDVETADLNNDGWPDLVIMQGGYKMNADNSVASKLDGITLWMNDAGNGFKFNHLKLVDSVNKYLFGFQDEGKVEIADMNGDGFKDLIMYGIKTPYKPRTDISTAKQDSVLWDANYIASDLTRPISYETRIYYSNAGRFSGDNYTVVNGLRATFPMGIDLNGDGRNDILAVWKNYRAGGFNGVYTDTTTNKNGINNQYYVFINKGSNQFEDQTASYFPSDNYKFGRLGRGDFYFMDLDGDGKKDFIPLTMGDDTLGTQYGAFAIDPFNSNNTVYYKNINNQNFKKTVIGSFVADSNEQRTLYFLNRMYIDDFNNDGANDILGFAPWFLAPITRCQTPILDSYIKATCGTDSIATKTIIVTNFNNKDSIIWNYNGTIIKSISDSIKVKDFGWIVATRKDSSGCVSFTSDTAFIRRSAKPEPPRIYSIGPAGFDASKMCKGDSALLAADPSSLNVTGEIKWYENGNTLSFSTLGGVKTIYETNGPRNIGTTSTIKINAPRTLYALFKSTDGCFSDTSNKLILSLLNNPAPVLSKDANNNLTATATGKISWYKYGMLLPDTTSTIKLTSSGSYAAISTLNSCPSTISSAFPFLTADLISQSSSSVKFLQQANYLGGRDTVLNLDGQHSFPRNYVSHTIVDLNGDGLKDLIIPYAYGPQGYGDVYFLRFFKNTGKGNFVESPNDFVNDKTRGKYLVGMSDGESTIIDFNKDGKDDFFYSDLWENSDYSHYDSIYGFVPGVDYFYKKINPTDIEKRLNSSGIKACSFFYQQNGKVVNGQNLFSPRLYGSTNAAKKYDFNKDGWDDLVTSSDPFHGTYLISDSSIIRPVSGILFWQNDVGKGFKLTKNISAYDTAKKTVFQIEWPSPTINLGDYNNDGFDDVLVYGSSYPYSSSNNTYDSLGWPIIPVTLDRTNVSHETRLYLSNNGSYDPTKYVIVPNMRALVSYGYDINKDGKLDVVSHWNNSNFQFGSKLDSISNKDGINDEIKIYINKGNNLFEDKTNYYFPTDTVRFQRMSIYHMKFIDFDGDSKPDIFPLASLYDTLYGKFTSAQPYPGEHATFYYKNYGDQFFKKQIIDTFFADKAWSQEPILKNLDSVWSKFYLPNIPSNQLPTKGQYLIDEYAYGNKVLLSDLNNDGKIDILGSAHMTSPIMQNINTYLQSKNIWTSAGTEFNMIIQCNPTKPIFTNTKFSFCAGDSIKISISNNNKGDVYKWYYGTKIDSSNIITKTFLDSTKLYILKTDSIGCAISSDTLSLVKFIIPSAPIISRDTSNSLVSSASIGNAWYKDGTLITDTTQKFKPSAAGSYTVKTSQNGCLSPISAAYYYLVTDIINLSDNEYIKLAPNPFGDFLNFDFVIHGYQKLNLDMYDIATGTKVASRQGIYGGSRLSFGEISPGIYIFKVSSADNKFNYQFKMVKL